MRTTITIDDTLFEEACEIAEDSNASNVVSKALDAYVAAEARKRLALLGGTAPTFSIPPRSSRAGYDNNKVAEEETPYNPNKDKNP